MIPKKTLVFIILSTFILLVNISPISFVDNTKATPVPISINTTTDWNDATSSSDNVKIESNSLLLDSAINGNWTSKWYTVSDVNNPQLIINTTITLFDRLVRTVVLDGSAEPYGATWDWYGRPCLYIDYNNHSRWIMGTRIGKEHSEPGDGVALLFSTDEGKTWGDFNVYYNGTTIQGDIPAFPPVYCGEPQIIRMPNGDLICYIWNGHHAGDFLQYRSTDSGFSWTAEGEKGVSGIPAADAIKASQDYFINPYNTNEVYIAMARLNQDPCYYSYLTKTSDNGSTYTLISSITNAVLEPGIEFVGNNSITMVLRPGDGHTGPDKYGQTLLRTSTDMGVSWLAEERMGWWIPYWPPVPGDARVWERARIYIESNPFFERGNYMNYTAGEGRLWGSGSQDFGSAQWAGTETNRTVCVYWSDEKGANGTWSWYVVYAVPPNHDVPPPAAGSRDGGYGDMKRRTDGSFCVVNFVCPTADQADLVQIDFGGERARVMVEVDTNGDGVPDENSGWHEIYNQTNTINLSELSNSNWRFKYYVSNNDTLSTPYIDEFYGTGFDVEDASIHFLSINKKTNGSNVYDSTPTINWTIAASASQYWLQIDNNADFSSPEINITDINQWNYPSYYSENATRVSFTIPDANALASYDKYHMRVKAYIKN